MKLPPLTYTQLRDFENCAHKYFRKYVKKDVKFVRTAAMDEGTKAHKAIEDMIQKGITLDPHLRCVEPICNVLMALPDYVNVRVEYFVGMLVDGTACAWDHQNVWLRLKADVATITPMGGWLIDWKTGRKWEDPFELECQAMVCHAHHPEVPVWQGEYFWLKDKELGQRYTLQPMDTFSKVAEMFGRMHAYLAQGDWPKTQNKLCGFCDVADCEFNTRPKDR